MSLPYPSEAKDYVSSLMKQYPTKLIVKKGRASKYGDYRFFRSESTHQITVNGNLSKESFLFVLIHEFAHRICFEQFKGKAKAHGDEWKNIFGELILQSLDEGLFDEGLARELFKFSKAPKSIVKRGTVLHEYLFPAEEKEGQVVVKSLKIGVRFTFRSKIYIRGELRRTRVVCEELETKKKYLFQSQTLVELYLE